MLKELVLKCRSYRRFQEDVAVGMDTLRELVDMARCTASATNRQPLKYILSCNPERNAQIFSCLHWAALLKTWTGPAEGERPPAYIIILGDKSVAPSFNVDHGIAAQTILLGAVEKGLGGCMLAAIDRDELKRLLALPDRMDVLLVIAIGKPKERVVIDALEPGGNTNYYRDKNDVHHVPKRGLAEVVVAAYE